MGKGSKRHRKTNHKRKSNSKKTNSRQKTRNMLQRLGQSGIPKVTSSDKPLSVIELTPEDQPIEVLLMPGSPEYETAFQKIYGKPGVPDDNAPLDILGRKKNVAAKTGTIDKYTPAQENKVLLVRDTLLDFPDLWLKVYIVGPPEDTRNVPLLFSRAKCTAANDIYDADLVVFTGGPDVDPAYYGEEPMSGIFPDENRDYQDISAYMICIEEGIPMTGICRGAQFGWVMHGGNSEERAQLYQNIDGHMGDHKMWDNHKKMLVGKVSSVHHQAVKAGPGMEILGISHESTMKWENDIVRVRNTPDIEAFFLRETCFFGVQGHPEYKGYHEYAKWYLDYINDLVILNDDIEWVGSRRRMRQSLKLERQLGIKPEREILTVKEGVK